MGFYFLKIFLGVVRCLLFVIAANGTLQPKTFGFLFIWARYKSCVLNLFHFALNVLFRD